MLQHVSLPLCIFSRSMKKQKRKKRKINNKKKPSHSQGLLLCCKVVCSIIASNTEKKSCSCTWNIFCLASKIMWRRWREREKLFLYIYKSFLMSDISLFIMLYLCIFSFFSTCFFVIFYDIVCRHFLYYYAIYSKLDEWKHFQYYIKDL